MPVAIGQLRHRAILESETVTTVRGKTESEWTGTGFRWMQISPLSGQELEEARQIVADATHQVLMRFSEDVNTRMRINFRGRYLYIRAALNEDERREKLNLICVERE